MANLNQKIYMHILHWHLMAQKHAKGAVLNGYLKFIKKKWGTNGLNEAMKYAEIEKMPLDSEWLPVIKFDLVMEWIVKNKRIDMVKEAGRYSARDLGIFG